MDADPSIPCGVPGGPNARMRAVAIVSILAFVLGLPVALAVFLWTRRTAVRVDQTLRERGEGETALTNPHFQVSPRTVSQPPGKAIVFPWVGTACE
jgi:hypothetical protein